MTPLQEAVGEHVPAHRVEPGQLGRSLSRASWVFCRAAFFATPGGLAFGRQLALRWLLTPRPASAASSATPAVAVLVQLQKGGSRTLTELSNLDRVTVGLRLDRVTVGLCLDRVTVGLCLDRVTVGLCLDPVEVGLRRSPLCSAALLGGALAGDEHRAAGAHRPGCLPGCLVSRPS